MKSNLTLITIITASLLSYGCQTATIQHQSKTVSIHAVSAQGIEATIGTVKFTDSKAGLVIQTDLTQLPAGPHGFHIHENPSCEPDTKDGVAGAALKAGSHYDPQKSGQHGHPAGSGHLGDLPLLEVSSNQTAKVKLIAPRLTLKDLEGRSVMIHAGGDNFSDTPAALGGGGARIACGVI